MVDPTRSNSDRPFSLSAVFSVLVGLVAVATLPAAIVAAEIFTIVTLLESAVAIVPAFVLAALAIGLGIAARRRSERTLGRVRGGSLARLGRVLGYFALYLAITATISVGTYYFLREFAS